MAGSTQSFISARGVQSLCWVGDDLVDWVGGGAVYGAQGIKKDSRRSFGYRFDSATESPSGRYAVIYERLGTKALLLDNGDILRELNRSFSEAEAFEYPVVLFQLPDGRDVLAHCPDQYSILEIEEVTTGKHLTQRPSDHNSDFYHSRLSVSPDAKTLMSAGWFWHPFDSVLTFDIPKALEDPTSLNSATHTFLNPNSEVNSANFVSSNLLSLYSSKTASDLNAGKTSPRITPGSLALFDMGTNNFISIVQVEEEVGIIMPVDRDFIVGLYEHPKLIEIKTGRVVNSWPDINSGKQISSIIWGIEMPPPIAIDSTNRRFAVANREGIFIVAL